MAGLKVSTRNKRPRNQSRIIYRHAAADGDSAGTMAEMTVHSSFENGDALSYDYAGK